MDCPNCGTSVAGVALVVGIVKLTSFHCGCGKRWRTKSLKVEFDRALFLGEIKRLESAYPVQPPPEVTRAIEYLKVKIEADYRQGLDAEEALRRRRNDNWERQFLRAALGG